MLVAIVGFLALVLSLNALLGPKPALSAIKQEPFECGASAVDVALLQGGGTFKNSTISGNVSQGTGGGGIAFLYPTWAGSFAARRTSRAR